MKRLRWLQPALNLLKGRLWLLLPLFGLSLLLLGLAITRASFPVSAPAPALAAPSEQAEIPPVPIGQERRRRDWDADISNLLFSRRTASSDLVGGLGGIAFDPTDCLRCHENAPDVEGQIFYGPDFTDFAKDQWQEMLSDPEAAKLAPVHDYDFIKAHEKRVQLRFGVFPEQQIRQNP